MPFPKIKSFFKSQSAKGAVLLLGAVLASALANSGYSSLYKELIHQKLGVFFASSEFEMPLLEWINQGLMTFFFLLMGLEIKKEFVEGELSSWHKAALPIFSAIGGMLGPALIFFAIAAGDGKIMRGWAIPIATDVAFALGVLSLLAKSVPAALKVFLTALAVCDDIIAILIIALFYSHDISFAYLGMAAAIGTVSFYFCWRGISGLSVYLLCGFLLWICMLKSGVHATLAGVLIAFFIPHDSRGGKSPAQRLDESIRPWVYFLVLPIFAFTNGGVSFADFELSSLTEPLLLAIACALFFGKQFGVWAFAWGALRLGWAKLPSQVNLKHVYGVGLVSGIGFTVSLFIASLTFSGAHSNLARLGIVIGSLPSGVLGCLFLKFYAKKPEETP